MGSENKQYAERDAYELDKSGGYYVRHVMAMTSEKLHAKSDIAAELGHRDMVIDQLRAEVEALRKDAGRYRWILMQPGVVDLSASIDAAMAAKEGK